MFIKLNQVTTIQTGDILYASIDGQILQILFKGANNPAEFIFDNKTQCESAFKKLNTRISAKGLSEGHEKKKYKEEKEDLFKKWWNLYQKKIGIEDCRKKFMAMSITTMLDVLKATPLYVAKTPDVKYRKHPKTWLNAHGWKDELEVIQEEEKVSNMDIDELF